MLRRSGYSLIELLVVLAMLALLAGMAMPLAEINAQRSRERELKRALWEIRDAIDAWRQAKLEGAFNRPSGDQRGGAIGSSPFAPPYPPDLLSLTQAHADQRPTRSGQVLRFLRRVPRDPFADPALPPEQTWGLRSYASEADSPRAGAEVYDVYTRSSGMGLNGVPLRQW